MNEDAKCFGGFFSFIVKIKENPIILPYLFMYHCVIFYASVKEAPE